MPKNRAADNDEFEDLRDEGIIADLGDDDDIEDLEEDDDDGDLLKDKKHYGTPKGDDDDDDEGEDDEEEEENEGEDDEEKETLRQEAADRAAEAEAARLEAEEKDQKLAAEQYNNYVMRVAFSKSEKRNFDRQIVDLRAKLEEADEEGETRKKHEIQDELDKAVKERDKYAGWIDELEKNPVEQPVAGKTRTVDKDKQTDKDPAAVRRNAPATQSWLRKNQWYTNPGSREEEYRKNIYTRVDNKLLEDVQSGKFKHGATTNQYYNELERRAKVEMDKTRGRSSSKTRKQTTAPVNGASRNADRKVPSKVKDTKLDKGDLQMARMMGMNMNDPAVRKEYKYQKFRTLKKKDEE